MTGITTRVRARAVALTAAIALTAGGVLTTTAPAEAATAPSGLRATYVAAKAVGLTWDATGEDAYRVRFSKSKTMSSPKTWDVIGNYFEWNRTDPNPTASASRLSPGTTYYFQVKSVKKGVTSAERESLSGYGPAIAVTTPKDAYPELPPVDLKATDGAPGTLYVSWRTRGPGVSYLLRYTTDPSVNVLKWSSAKFPSAGGVLTGLKAGTKYYLRARVLDSKGKALSNYSGTTTKTTAKSGSPGITVASYNILKTGGSPSWTSRRTKVAANIKAQKPQVVALQEATPASVKGVGGKKMPQYTDILKLIGSKYAYVTSEGSSGTRLAYDTGRLSVVGKDAVKLYTLGSSPRYAVWAILKDKQTGKQFFVLNTHLEPGSNSTAKYNDARIKQAKQVLNLIEDNNPKDLPVIVAGDMNASRSAKPNNGPYLTYTEAGLIDPLDNAAGNWASGENAMAEHGIDVEYSTYNNLERTARRTAYPVGTNVDYILVSKGIRVAQWRTVVTVDTNRKFVGTIPSDHNLVTAIVHLP